MAVMDPSGKVNHQEGTQGKREPSSFITDIFRLSLIKDLFKGKVDLCRGTRDSFFVESWVKAVSHDDGTKPGDPGYKPHIILGKTQILLTSMREFSPHEGGRQIEVLKDLLAAQPQTMTLLGTPYDVPPAGPFTKFVRTLRGKDPEEKRTY